MNKNKKKYVSLIMSMLVVATVMLIGFTFAYYRTRIIGNKSEEPSISVTSKKLEVVYSDNKQTITADNIYLGWTTIKTFSVENTGDETISYNIIFDNIENEFTKGGWFYHLKKLETVPEVELIGTKYEVSISEKCGDVNNDNEINSSDVDYLKRYIDGEKHFYLTNYEKRLADINGDGELTDADLTILEEYIINNETLECGNKSFGDETIYYGDVDLDGRVTLKDANLILDESADLVTFNSIQKNICDLDNDNGCGSMDSLAIKKYIAGEKNELISFENIAREEDYQLLEANIAISPGEKHNYVIKFEYIDTGMDQSDDMARDMSLRVNIEETLQVPNGPTVIPENVTITYDGNYPDVTNLPESETISYGSDYTLSSLVPVKGEMYTFLGWTSNRSCEGEIMIPGGILQNVQTDMTLYACWSVQTG